MLVNNSLKQEVCAICKVPDTIAGMLKKKLINFIMEKRRIKSNAPFFTKRKVGYV